MKYVNHTEIFSELLHLAYVANATFTTGLFKTIKLVKE